ncbi:MAG: helix-turn-helix domain-containing protein [Galactobacter sp.]
MATWGVGEDHAADIGLHLKQWRLIRGMSQQLVADRAEVSRGMVARLERGDQSVGLGGFFAVVSVLGLAGTLADALDPLSSEEGRARAHLLHRKIAPRR